MLSWSEVREALDEELARLPDALRAPILLCYFDGLTQDEAATELGSTARSVKDRVARGRALLYARLTRRGIELPAVLAGLLVSNGASAALLPILRGRPASPAVAALVRTERTMSTTLQAAILSVAAAGVLAAGVLAGRRPEAASSEAILVAEEPKPESVGAVLIGTKHFRDSPGWHKRVFFLNDKTLLTAGDGPAVRFWDIEIGQVVHEIALSSMYMDAAFSRTANLLAVVGIHAPGGDSTKAQPALWLIDTATRKVLHVLPMAGNRGNNQKVRISDDGKHVFVEFEGDVRVIDTKTGETLTRHNARINAGAVAVSADGKLVAVGRYDVLVWDWEAEAAPKKIAAIGGVGTEQLLFSPDGKSLFISTRGGIVSVHDATTGRKLRTLELGGVSENWVFSPDGKSLAMVHRISTQNETETQSVVVVNPESGAVLTRFSTGRMGPSHVAWSADGSRLAAVSDHRVWAWDVKAGRPLGPPATGHEASISALVFGPDGTLYTASDDHSVRSWGRDGKPLLSLNQDSWVRGTALSPDGSLLAGSALRDDLRIWDAKTGQEKFRILGNGTLGGTRRLRFTSDGKRLVAWGDDLYLRVWDMRNGKLLTEHRTLPDGVSEADLDDPFRSRMLLGVWSADISPDGSAFAFTQHMVVQVLDVQTGKEKLKFTPDPNGTRALTFSPDGKRLAVCGRSQQLALEHHTTVWDLATKKFVWLAATPGSWPRDVRFSDDGSRLAELLDPSDKKYAVLIRDAATGKELGRVELPSRGSHIAWDRAGKRLGVAFWDTTAMVYDLESALKPAK